MKVCQLIPRIGSLGCGVGDYAALLAGRLDEGHGIESNFLAVELGPDACKVGPTAKKVARRAEILAEALEGQHRVLLHFVGYGYQKRGCPVWLLRGLKAWKRRQKGARLITMFYELYESGLPWQSSFWTSPLQRGICRELARLSDGLVTNRAESARILNRMTGRTDVLHLPVLSNVGETNTRQPIGDWRQGPTIGRFRRKRLASPCAGPRLGGFAHGLPSMSPRWKPSSETRPKCSPRLSRNWCAQKKLGKS